MSEVFNLFVDTLKEIWQTSGLYALFQDDGWKSLIMIAISFVFMYLAIAKQFEPLLLLPIAFGMFLTNLPLINLDDAMYHPELFDYVYEYAEDGSVIDHYINYGQILKKGGLLDILYLGVKLGIYPPIIFLGIGTMTDFAPLIANPKSFLLGAAAQGGIFFTFIGAAVLGFSAAEAGSIAIIGGADGPTAIYVSTKLLSGGDFKISTGTIALAAYTYMALVPVIQPPIMKALTTKKERAIKMATLRTVTRTERLIFPVAVTLIVALIVPSAAPLVGMLMLGNLFKESGVVSRISNTAQNELMNIVTIFLGVTVGATATGQVFLSVSTLGIILLGLIAFCMGTACGVLFGKIMCAFTHGKVNPLIGSAGVSAVPMAARISQKVGQEENPANFLLMHAMGPNVAGVIGSAVAAGVLISQIPH